MKSIKSLLLILALLPLVSCYKDLDTTPIDPDEVTADKVFENKESYKEFLAKLYAGLAVSGQQGPAGQADIAGIDEGFGQYLRGFWYHQELPTDEAIIGWNDQTIKDFHDHAWTSSDAFIFAFYSRVLYQVALANEFLRATTEDKVSATGLSGSDLEEVQSYRAEARFLRALSYWHGLDQFRNTPFATDADVLGESLPEQIKGVDLFSFIESELLAIETQLPAPRSGEYGRADQGAVWMLLAKLYLNAEVYTGSDRYSDCLNYCEKLIGAGYTLDPTYEHVFMADNHTSPEIIFPVTFDGLRTRTWGGMTFIIRAGIGGSMDPSYSGVASGWGGTRTTKEFIEKFPSGGGTVIDPNKGSSDSYRRLYVPGTHNDFNYSDKNSIITSPRGNNIYEGHLYIPSSNSALRFSSIPSSSAPSLGDTDADGTLDTNGDDIIIESPGFYAITVNLNDNSYSIVKKQWLAKGTALASGEEKLEWDEEIGALRLKTDLSEGTLYFTDSDGSTVLGDADGDALLEKGDDPYLVPKSGGFDIQLFIGRPDYTYALYLTSFDRRGLYYSDGQKIEIDDVTLFTDGYAINKFRNVTSSGEPGSDTDFPDTDFPMFRLADVYLMASEALLRSGGSKSKAAEYFNTVRERAYTGTAGNISEADLDLDLILDERARELFWECHRRTDLIRFGKFTSGDYLWAWKGGVKEGKASESHRIIYPIPSADLSSNPNLSQNDGY